MKKTSKRMASLLLAALVVMTAISVCFTVSAETTPYYYDSYITPADYYYDDYYQTKSNYLPGDYITHSDYVTESDYVYVTDPETGESYVTKSDYLVKREWTEIRDKYTGVDYSDESCYVTRADYIRESYRYDDLSGDTVSWHFYNSGGYVTDSDYYYPTYGDVTFTLNTRTGVFRVSGWGQTPGFGGMTPWEDYYGYFIKKVIIEDGITGIGSNTFNRCSNLTDIVIPGRVTGIGDNAFSYCTGLTKLVIPDSVTGIGDNAFSFCTGLTKLVIPDSVTGTGYDLIRGCSELRDIYYTGNESQWRRISIGFGYPVPSYITVHYNCFQGGYQTSSNYGEDVLYSGSCGDNAVWKLTYEYSDEGYELVLTVSGYGEMKTDWNMLGLRRDNLKVIISEGITAIDDYAFYELLINRIYLPSTLKKIGDYAFYRSNIFSDLVLPESVEYIGKDAFRGIQISYLEINRMYPDMHSVLYGAFSACSDLAYIRLGKNITCIPEKAFFKCMGIEYINYSQNLESIGDYAFAYCTTLKNLYRYSDEDYGYGSEKIIKYIGDGAFYCCYKLEYIYFDNGLEHLGAEAFYKCFSLKWAALPQDTKRIERGTFAYCKSLEISSLPICLEYIGEYAFYGCESIKSLHIGLNLQSVGTGSFAHCVSLESIEFPDTLERVYMSAFFYCEKLKDLYFSDSVLYFCYDGLYYPLDTDITIHAPAYSTAYYYAIENGYNFVSTGFAKRGNALGVTWKIDSDLKLSLTPNSDFIPDISAYTDVPWFPYTDKITSLDIGEGVETIGANVFARMVNLRSVSLPSTLKKIRNGAFADCRRLDNVLLPDGVIEIGDRAFSNCSSLSNIYIPDTVIVVGDYAFYRCARLSSVNLGGVIYLGNYAFSKCTKLENAYLGKQLASIGECTFEKTAINELYVPESVTFIDCNAFSGNDDITLLCHYKSYAVDFAEENLINYLILGDASGDGELNAVDLSAVKKLLFNGDGTSSSVLDINRDDVFDLLDFIAIKKILSGDAAPAKPEKINPKDILQYEKDYTVIKQNEDGSYRALIITFYNDIENANVGTYIANFAGTSRLCENEGEFIDRYIYEEYNPETDQTEIVVEEIYADTPLTLNGKTWWYSRRSSFGNGGGLEFLLTDEEIIVYIVSSDIYMKLKPNADGSLTVVRSYNDSFETGDVFTPTEGNKFI